MSAPPLPESTTTPATATRQHLPAAIVRRRGSGATIQPVRRLAHAVTALDAAFVGLLALTIALDGICARFALGWPSAGATNVICALYLLGLALARPTWRPLLARLFLLGFAAGVLELFTDYAGERVAHSLIYPAGEPLLWGSPYYMPLSWAIVLAQLGYLAWRLRSPQARADASAPRGVPPPSPSARARTGPLPLWGAVAIAGLAGAVLVPFYEEMAWYARWWRYSPVALTLGHTPLYVLIFEGAIGASLPVLVGRLLTRPLHYIVVLGLLEGTWMPVAALIAWLAIGR